MTHPDMKAAILRDKIRDFARLNNDTMFTLNSENQTLEISRNSLIRMMDKVIEHRDFLSRIRDIFHELAKP